MIQWSISVISNNFFNIKEAKVVEEEVTEVEEEVAEGAAEEVAVVVD